MNIERRVLLKGMALGGLAGVAMSSSGLTMANRVMGSQAHPVLPTLALVSGEVAESAFLQGISASPAGGQVKVQRTDLGLSFMLGLDKRLRSGQPQRIIGLVDDASAALIIDLARSAGARRAVDRPAPRHDPCLAAPPAQRRGRQWLRPATGPEFERLRHGLQPQRIPPAWPTGPAASVRGRTQHCRFRAMGSHAGLHPCRPGHRQHRPSATDRQPPIAADR